MGCFHSTGTAGMKTRATDADTGGVHFQADPHMHPGILQLAEVGYFLGGGGRSAAPKVFPEQFKKDKSVFCCRES